MGTLNYSCSIEHSPGKQAGSSSQLENQKKVKKKKKKSPSEKKRDALRAANFLENKRNSKPVASTFSPTIVSLDYSVVSDVPFSEEILSEENEETLETKPSCEKESLDSEPDNTMEVDENSTPVMKPFKIMIEPIKNLLNIPPPQITHKVDFVICSKNLTKAQSQVRLFYNDLTEKQPLQNPIYNGPQINNKVHHFIFSLILTTSQYNIYKFQKNIDKLGENCVILSRIDNETIKPAKQLHCKSCFKKDFKKL